MFWRHPKLVSNWTQTWHFWGTVYILCWIERLFRYLSIRMQPVGNHLIQTWMFVTGARRNCCRQNCPLILVKTCILQYTNKSTRICSECSYVPSPLLYINPFFFSKLASARLLLTIFIRYKLCTTIRVVLFDWRSTYFMDYGSLPQSQSYKIPPGYIPSAK